MKVKLYFRTLDDLWSIQYTQSMIWVLQILNYYYMISCIDFALEIFTSTKMMELDDVNIKIEFG